MPAGRRAERPDDPTGVVELSLDLRHEKRPIDSAKRENVDPAAETPFTDLDLDAGLPAASSQVADDISTAPGVQAVTLLAADLSRDPVGIECGAHPEKRHRVGGEHGI